MENKDQEKSFCQYFETFKQSIMKNAQKNNEIVSELVLNNCLIVTDS